MRPLWWQRLGACIRGAVEPPGVLGVIGMHVVEHRRNGVHLGSVSQKDLARRERRRCG